MKKKKAEPIKEVDEMIPKTEPANSPIPEAAPLIVVTGAASVVNEFVKPVNPAVAVLGDGCRCHVCKNWFDFKDVKTEEFKRINFLFIHLWKTRGYVCRNCRRD